MQYVAALGLSRAAFDEVAERFTTRTFRGREYHHLRQRTSALPPGTAIVDGTPVRGFPSVPRTLQLAAGIQHHFDGEFVVEEKLNGYNVRVVRLDDGTVLAVTRSGVVCPFTTWVVRQDLDLAAFFDAHPDAMLCGEMVGPENPYTTCDYPEVDSIGFFAFDVRDRASGHPMSVPERRECCERFGIPQVRSLGRFDPGEGDEVMAVVEALAEDDREGIVMKSRDGERLLKYTTSAANQGNLRYGFAYPFDYGKEYLFPRLLREAFMAVEQADDAEALRERQHAIGEAILGPFVEAIRAVEAGETLGETHVVRGDPIVLDELLEHLGNLGLTITIESDRTRDGERVLAFSKEYRSSTDSILAYLDGQPFGE
ncbi:RNA ligase [Haloarchaeobius amylolyticus]|uniref:RNA ligase n=1 Tax=Haloarchaeobius amylolyticus TaxID=1198296 RepID=UPI00226D465B|nr:RNA ligase [Haloarchaeobius amylolyticus]